MISLRFASHKAVGTFRLIFKVVPKYAEVDIQAKVLCSCLVQEFYIIAHHLTVKIGRCVNPLDTSLHCTPLPRAAPS